MIGESTKEKDEAIEALGKLSKGRTAYYEAGYAIHTLAAHAETIYKSPKTTEDQKRLLLSHVFSNLTLNADRISPNYTLGFEFLAEWVPKLNIIFELAESSPIKGKEDAFASSHPTLLRRQDSNLRPRDYMCSSCFQDAWTISSPSHECIRSEALRPLTRSTPLRDSL
jgi:hypothetical protein